MRERSALHLTATPRTSGRTSAVITALLIAVAAVHAPPPVSARPFTIVSTPASDSLAVVDLASHSVVATVPLSGLPTGSAVQGRSLYVALSGSSTLALIDMAKGGIDYVPVGAGPTGVAVGPRPRFLYVANTGAGTVSVVDQRLATVVRTITVGDQPVDIVTGGKRLYVANWGGGTVSVIDSKTDSVLATIPVGSFPAGLAFDRRADRLYVANFFDDTVAVIDTDTLSVVSSIPVVRRPRGLALDAKGRRLFVAGFEDGRLQVIDTRTGAVTQDVPSGGLNPLDLMLGPQGKHLYVTHFQGSQGVAVLDATTLAPVASVDVPAGPVSFAGISPKRPPSALSTGLLASARTLFHRLKAVPGRALQSTFQPLAQALNEVVISDSTFNPADWAVSATGQHETTQETTGGNPGAWRRTTHFGAVETVHRLIRPGSGYDPASQGAIGSIDVSWDRSLLGETIASEGFVVEQDGIVYRTAERSFFSFSWQTETQALLVASSFDDGRGGRPDFSAGGTPLRFGYFRRTAFSGAHTHGIDNFTVTVRGGNPASDPGMLAFRKPMEVAEEEDALFVFIERVGGNQGAVTVDVFIEGTDGSTSTETISWPDGDNASRSVLVIHLGLPDGAGARTARLALLNPTGGATIHPTRGVMAILVFPETWPPILQALFLGLVGLFGAFSPTWLLILAVPAALAARRSWRGRRRGTSAHPQP